MSSAAPTARSSKHGVATYVFEAPVRIWHWAHAISIAVLAVTGYLIAHPLPSVEGDPSQHFVMGNIRMIHFIAAYVFAIGFAVRIYWAFVGNEYARELFVVPLWKARWWREFLYEIKFYLFMTRDMHKTPGHNPLAQSAMWLFNVALGVFMILTGFALYAQGLGAGSWADGIFGWVTPVTGGPQNLRMWHLLGMWLFVVFAILHIYMAVRADIIGRQSSISTIIGGWRLNKDDLP